MLAFAFQARVCYDLIEKQAHPERAIYRPFTYRAWAFDRTITLFQLAEEAGLKPGDQVVEINGVPVTGTTVYHRALHHARPGHVMRLKSIPQGKTMADAEEVALDARVGDLGRRKE